MSTVMPGSHIRAVSPSSYPVFPDEHRGAGTTRVAVRNNASHHVIWRFSLGNTWHELAAPLWVLSAAIPI
jgi:hypothetical protein